MEPEPLEPTLEQALVTHVRASTLSGLLREIDACGAGPRAELIGQLGQPAQAVFREPLGSFQWVEAALVNELVTAFEARFGLDSLERRVQHTVRQQLTVIHAWMLKLLSPETIFHQAATLYRFNYRGGVARADEIRRGHARVTIWSHGLYPSWYCRAFPDWLEGALALVGARAPKVLHQPPEAGFRHRYEIGWES